MAEVLKPETRLLNKYPRKQNCRTQNFRQVDKKLTNAKIVGVRINSLHLITAFRDFSFDYKRKFLSFCEPY